MDTELAPAPLGEAEAPYDERFEFDAPRFYDFDAMADAAGSPDAAAWFNTDGPKGLATPPSVVKAQKKAEKKERGAAGATAGTTEDAHSQQQQQQQQHNEGGGKAGKGKEARRALAPLNNPGSGTAEAAGAKAGQQKQQQQQHKSARPDAKRKAAGAAAGSEPSISAADAAAGGSKGRPASTKQQQQQQPRRLEPPLVVAPPVSTYQASSPRLHLRPRVHPGEHKTTEQLELERVAAEKEAAAALRRRNAAAVKHVLAPPPPAPAHSSRPLTEPQPLELNTSKRRRMHGMETRSMSPFKSMAEKMAAFEGRVAGKTRLGKAPAAAAGSSGAGSSAAAAASHGQHALTVPQSPRFATKRRVRPPRFKPREVVEEEEMAAMPKFKARPVNKRIMGDRSGHLGVPHVDVKPPTVPAPFAFKTDQRAAEHGSAGAPAGGDVFVFGAGGGEGARLTRSKAGKKAAHAWTGQLTQPAPFHLETDARGKRAAAGEEHHDAHQEARPAKRARRAAAGPPQLATDVRGAAEEARLEGIRRQQEEQARRDAEFKALPLNKAALAGAWHPPPAAPASLTVPHDMQLASEARASQRRAFDDAVAAKAAEAEAEARSLAELQAAAEEEEVRELRKRLVHRPQPLP